MAAIGGWGFGLHGVRPHTRRQWGPRAARPYKSLRRGIGEAAEEAAGATRSTRRSAEQVAEVVGCPIGNCFRAGTKVATPAGSTPIDGVRVGQRVVTSLRDDDSGEARSFPSQIDPATWRTIRLVMHEDQPDQVDITLLRPQSFVDLHGMEVEAEFAMELADVGVSGMARVVEIGGCPAIEESDEQTTRVVTATFTHHAGQPWELRLEGQPEPIGVTPRHLVWRTDAECWQAVRDLEPGARVRLLDDSEGVVESLTELSAVEPVYNLEVDADHVYRVTDAGVLVHNQSCPLVIVKTVEGEAAKQVMDVAQLIRHDVEGAMEVLATAGEAAIRAEKVPWANLWLLQQRGLKLALEKGIDASETLGRLAKIPEHIVYGNALQFMANSLASKATKEAFMDLSVLFNKGHFGGLLGKRGLLRPDWQIESFGSVLDLTSAGQFGHAKKYLGNGVTTVLQIIYRRAV